MKKKRESKVTKVTQREFTDCIPNPFATLKGYKFDKNFYKK